VLVDVTPRALMVETVGGFCDVVIPRNAKIPCERTRSFATVSDLQTRVRVRIAQGEDQVFERNTFLGELELAGLRAAPRGETVVSVTFELDTNGTMRVRASDARSGREALATLQLIGIAEEEAIAEMTRRHAAQRVVHDVAEATRA
jgi:molecular chaperone DnaK